MRTQVQNLIISGSTKEQILSITGLSVEALDEMLEDKDFHREVREIREANREAEIDKEYSQLELSAIKQVKKHMDLYDATALCRVLETVARTRQLKKAGPQAVPNNGFNHPTVHVNIPVFLGTSNVVMDSKKQVVAIDGRNMAPLPTPQVKKLFQELERTNSGDPNEDPILADYAERHASEAEDRAAA